MSESSADPIQQEIAEEFALFGDWSERYQYLIDLGRALPEFPQEWRDEAHRLHGCQSNVWVHGSGDAARLHFAAISDSAIVSGLIALCLRVYSDRSAQRILETKPTFIEAIGLGKHLSVTRANGLAALIQRIQSEAAEALRRGG